MPPSRYTIERISSAHELLRIREDWDRLSIAADQPNVFTTFDWYEAWFQCFARGDQTGLLQRSVFVLRDNGAVCGIAPLTFSEISKFGVRLRRLRFACRNHEWDYNDLLVGKDLDCQATVLANYLNQNKGDWDLVDLMDVRAAGGAVSTIQLAMKRVGLRCLVLDTDERCPYFPIEGTWEQMIHQRSRSTRRSFRNRQLRQSKTVGDRLRVRILDAPHKDPELLSRMIALEAQKRSRGVQSAPFLGEYARVFESLWTALSAKGWLCVTLLELDDRMVAFQLLFRCGKKLWGYLTAYDHELAYLSPGSTLIPEAANYGFRHGFDEFDFLSGEEGYKLHWATDFHLRSRILIWNDRMKSKAYSTLLTGHLQKTALDVASTDPPYSNDKATWLGRAQGKLRK